MRRACERWGEGDKARAYFQIAHARLPPSGEDRSLRLFVADELIDVGRRGKESDVPSAKIS
ncbi:MAG: hypothetical protein ACRECP_00040 [Methylocella sp.]